MSTDGMHDIVALFFGVGIIIAFSHERFNRISYETGKRLDRLVSFLTPDKLRARRQVTYAYFIYTLSLIILYLILCGYAEILLPLIGGQNLLPEIGASTLPSEASTSPPPASDTAPEPTTGFAPMESSAIEFWIANLEPTVSSEPVETNSGVNIAPEVSMGLALIMVGLAPSIKALVRVDEWLRMFAHRVAGIPTWVIDTSDALRSNAKVLRFFTDSEADNSSEYLISEPERKRVIDLHEKAKPFLGNLDDFILNIEVILVASAWFLDEKLRITGTGDKNRFEEIENELRRRKNELFSNANSPDLSHEGWEAVATAADELASDFCVLIALYDEQDVIHPYDQRPAPTESQRRARDRLRQFVDVLYKNKTEPLMQRRGNNLALFWTLAIVLSWTVAWAVLWPGQAEFNLIWDTLSSDTYRRIRLYSVNAFNTYCIATIVAITFRWVRMTSVAEDGQRKWENMRYPNHWTRWLPQALSLFSIAFLVSTALNIAVQLWLTETRTPEAEAWRMTFEEFIISIRWRFEYMGPISFRAACLALLVTVLLDARQRLWTDAGRYEQKQLKRHKSSDQMKSNAKTWRELSMLDSLSWVAVGALMMLIITPVMRYLSFLAATQDYPRDFDHIDAGLMIWATLYAVVLAAAVMFCLSEVLTRRAFYRASKDPADGRVLEAAGEE
ncbi:hypothetical protein [Shimia sp.]|uniref:hypothetical protein n=1 Tax=Shimia sp. TaxID=1954381 RepID=UPI003BAA2A4F